MIKDENFVNKQGWMINKLGLKGTELEVYAIIYGFSQTEGQMFTGSLQYIADWIGCSRRTVYRCVDKLVLKNYIKKHETKNGCNNFYFANLSMLTYDKMSQVPMAKCHRTYDKMSYLINKDNNKNINNKGKTATELYNSFPQNHYNMDELEKELLSN